MTRRPQSFNEGSRRSSTTPTSGSVATCSSCPRNSCSTLLRNICRSDVSFQAKTALTFTLLSRSASTLPVLDLVFQIPEVCLNIRVQLAAPSSGCSSSGRWSSSAVCFSVWVVTACWLAPPVRFRMASREGWMPPIDSGSAAGVGGASNSAVGAGTGASCSVFGLRFPRFRICSFGMVVWGGCRSMDR